MSLLFKYTLICIILISPALGREPDRPELEIDRIYELEDHKKIHKALLKLKKYNQNYKRRIIKRNAYLPDKLFYALSLEQLLQNIPSKLEDMPSCFELKSSILNSYKTEDWNKLPSPTQHIWPIFEKICAK